MIVPLNEYIEINEQIEDLLESEQTFFTDEQVEKAEYFDFKWNPVSYGTELHIYDADGVSLGSVEFEDADLAIEVAMSMFDFDEEDLREIEDYTWAKENSHRSDREYAALADDGTSDAE